MIIKLKRNITDEEKKGLIKKINESLKIEIIDLSNEDRYIYGIIGDEIIIENEIMKILLNNPMVDEIKRIDTPYKLANREFKKNDTVINVNGVLVGGDEKIVVIGGPCTVEEEKLTLEIAKEIKNAGASMLRGGAYKPRTSPYSFQGLGLAGIECLVKAKEKYNLPIVSEIMTIEKLDEFAEHVDLIQIGARNMQNFELLKSVGMLNKPVLLKRGFSNTIEEWIMSAEYIMSNGNKNVILCERGIRTFENYTRNTLDLSVIPIIKEKTHLPIIIDPCHSTGNWRYIEAVSLAAIAAGADGLLIEVHTEPENALCDGAQSLKPKKLKKLMEKCKKIALAVERKM